MKQILVIATTIAVSISSATADNVNKEKKTKTKAPIVKEGETSNSQGVIQIGLGWGAVIGGASVTTTSASLTSNERGAGLNGYSGLRVQYGINEMFSAGIYLRREGAIYATAGVSSTTNTGSVSATSLAISGIGAGIEGKFYAVNNRSFALYIAPKFGYSSGKDEFLSSNNNSTLLTGKGSGLNYGATLGFNWWWGKHIGMSTDFGYNASTTKFKYTDALYSGFTTKVNNSGFYVGIGLVGKFGGN